MLTNQTAKGPPRRPQSIDSLSVTGLAISPYEGDLAFLRRMFDDARWKLFTAHTYKEAMAQLSHHRMPLILCESQLPDGKWTDVLSQLAPMPDSPRLIVMSQAADEKLCAEVVKMGGFGVVSTPLKEIEVGCAIGSAWIDWNNEQQRSELREAFAATNKSAGWNGLI